MHIQFGIGSDAAKWRYIFNTHCTENVQTCVC